MGRSICSHAMEDTEQRQEEVEALESIYGDDFSRTAVLPRPHQGSPHQGRADPIRDPVHLQGSGISFLNHHVSRPPRQC